jgi:hypothetical protein
VVKRLNLQVASHISFPLVSSNEVVWLLTPQSPKMTRTISYNEVELPFKLQMEKCILDQKKNNLLQMSKLCQPFSSQKSWTIQIKMMLTFLWILFNRKCKAQVQGL